MEFESPSLRTGQADLPHPALQSVVLPPRGLTGGGMGRHQREQPALRKVGFGPALMIRSASRSLSAPPAAQDAAQSHAHPTVQRGERGLMAVLKIPKPAPQGLIQIDEGGRQALPVRAPGLGSNCVSKFSLTLPAWPFAALLEMVAEKIEAPWLGGVHNSRLDRMQSQSGCCRPALHLFQRPLSFPFRATQHHEVVCVPHHLDASLHHPVVERIQIDIGQQRTDHRALGRSRFRCPEVHLLQYSLCQECFQQLQRPPIGDLRFHPLQQFRSRDGVEVALQIRIDDPAVTLLQQGIDAAQRVLAAPFRSESVALRCEVPLEYRLQHCSERRLRHPVAHRGNPQRALFFAAQLVNPMPPHRLRSITAVRQRMRELFQVRFQVALELFHRHVVHARRPVVRLHSRKGLPQVGQRVHLVNQPEPLASLQPCFQGRQHPFGPNRRFHPVPAGSYPPWSLRFSGLLSRLRHYRRSCFRGLLPHVSTFLRPFAPDPLQALLRSYGRSDSCSPGSSAFSRHELRLLHEQVSLIHAPGLPTIPSPTTCGRSASSGHATPRRVEPRLLPHGNTPNGNSGLRHSLAGSPHRTGRIEFLIVRTGRSPPAAPHPVSPRRSCRPITSYVDLERTFTSLTKCALRRTSGEFTSPLRCSGGFTPPWRRKAASTACRSRGGHRAGRISGFCPWPSWGARRGS